MSTATMGRTDALEQVEELLQEAKELKASLAEMQQNYEDKMKEIRNLLDSDESEELPVRATKPAVSTAPHRGRPVGSTNKSNAKKAAPNGKVAPTERNYTNPVGLKQTIWDVLNRNPNNWAKIIKDLPKDAEGLTVSEIREIIEAEGKWKSSSDNISTQLSTHLTHLRGEKLISRADGGRYYINEGAELVTGKRGRKAAA